MSEFFEATIATCRICGARFCPQDGGPECDCGERLEELRREEEADMYMLINWTDTIDYSDVGVVMQDDGSGKPKLFDTEEEAEKYAQEELNGEWVAVELG